jgi:hypothetical protein
MTSYATNPTQKRKDIVDDRRPHPRKEITNKKVLSESYSPNPTEIIQRELPWTTGDQILGRK